MIPKSRIGLFGGTFDPIHVGHLIVAEWVQNHLGLSSVYFIPNYLHPFHKRKNISSAEDRLRMVELALRDFPAFKLSTYEIENKGVSYTIDTINYFRKINKKSELFYLIGKDNLTEFFNWKEPEKILDSAKVVVYDRIHSATSGKEEWDSRFEFLECPLIEISSTMIRENIKQNKPVRSLLPSEVFKYIQEKKLYTKA